MSTPTLPPLFYSLSIPSLTLHLFHTHSPSLSLTHTLSSSLTVFHTISLVSLSLSLSQACKFALRLIGRLLCSVSVGSMFQKHLLGEASLHYGEFINNLSKHIISDFPEKINFYVMGCMAFFRSVWPEIRANAVMFAGFLLGNLTPSQLQTVSLEHVCAAILMLLQDGSPEVRMKAAEALSLLHGL
uniref:Maestro/Maestro-like HEAT-repeats domain-containing protein n=1 Tax=Callorhinchus milii TaxID=7868 RepID=A0A4W3GPK1_CALMI